MQLQFIHTPFLCNHVCNEKDGLYHREYSFTSSMIEHLRQNSATFCSLHSLASFCFFVSCLPLMIAVGFVDFS